MKQLLFFSILILLSFSSCKNNKTSSEEQPKTNHTIEQEAQTQNAIAVMNPKSGSNVTGKVEFRQEGKKVVMNLTLEGFETNDGKHAIHIHETGDCSAEDGTSAGGHWNPHGHDHGKWGTDNHHLGDITNLTISENGTTNFSMITEKWTLLEGENNIIGKSIIVHAQEDDFTTQPTGAAGTRIACGVIEQQ